MVFPGGSGGKESVCNVGDPGLIPGLGRSPGEGNGDTIQYSCLEHSMDGGAWGRVGYSPWGGKEFDMTEQLTHRDTKSFITTTKLFKSQVFTSQCSSALYIYYAVKSEACSPCPHKFPADLFSEFKLQYKQRFFLILIQALGKNPHLKII